MSLASWLADGAEPARMAPEEVRRLRNLLGVREEQSIACLEALLGDAERSFHRGNGRTRQRTRHPTQNRGRSRAATP